jgi:ubiquitin carboxyl-terminal hydrolase 2/21
LQHCLDLFGKEEILDGDEKPVRTRHLDISIPVFHLLGLSNFTYFFFTILQTCSKCQTRRKCTKKFTIHKFPQILVLRKFSATFSKFFFFSRLNFWSICID